MKDIVNRLIRKLKNRLRQQKMSRKQAVLQNFLLSVLVIVLGSLILRSYIDNYSIEAMTEKWCEEMYFGDAEILAVMEYEGVKYPMKDVIIGRETAGGERYEANLTFQREKPWRWVCTAYAYNASPVEYVLDMQYIEDWGNDIYRVTQQSDIGIFPELLNAEWVEAAYVPTHVMEGMEPGPDSHMSLQVGIQFEESDAANGGQWHRSELTYWVNLDRMEVEQIYFQPIQYDGKDAQLWISEDRMVFIARKLMEMLPASLK